MSTVQRLFILAFLPLFVILQTGGLFLPAIAALRWVRPAGTPLMLLRAGPIRYEWVPLSRVSKVLPAAVIAAEDADFYRHHGIDFREARVSWEKNRRKRRYARGFSTITMQLAKNLYLVPHKFLVRKGLEIGIAMEMELLLPKERILEIYLNVVEWGRGIYGVEAASRHYFKKSAASLTPEEAAFLAAILPNPRRWGR